MDIESETAGSVEGRPARGEERRGLRVRVGKADFPVTSLSERGFVIFAEGRPPLRGFADIFEGDRRIVHGLVTCAWHEGEEVGYEFKRASVARPVAADYAPGAPYEATLP